MLSYFSIVLQDYAFYMEDTARGLVHEIHATLSSFRTQSQLSLGPYQICT